MAQKNGRRENPPAIHILKSNVLIKFRTLQSHLYRYVFIYIFATN